MTKLSGKNVVVTGGAGFIGSNLVDRIILENPAKLIVVDNFFLGQESNLVEARAARPDLGIYRLDASDLASMRELADKEKIDVVFNLAVIPLPMSLTYPRWTIRTNVEIATTSCELARLNCINTLIHCSSSEVYGSAMYIPMDEKHPRNATTPYAASKAAEDMIVLSYLRTFKIDATIVRPFNNFGPRQNPGSYAGIIPIVIQRVLAGQPIEIFGDGEQTRDYNFVRDTADAILKVYEEPATRGQELNIATGHEITILSLVERLLNIMKVPNHPVIHAKSRMGDVRKHCGDVSLAQKLIGLNPLPVTDDQLEETVSWYLKRFK
jgi:UDP-glucose 4-epimerase